jgi:hypothetical protein
MDFYFIRVKSNNGEIYSYAMNISKINEILHKYKYSWHCLFGLKRLRLYISYNDKYISGYLNDSNENINLLDLLRSQKIDAQIRNRDLK